MMNVSREDPLGQLLVMGLEEERWTASTARLLHCFRPGGVILSARNLRAPESTAELLREIFHALPVPLFLALHEEGGTVHPLGAFLPPLPSPRVAAKRGRSAVARLGELTGAGLRLLGFNTNLAPALDLSTRLSEPSLATRTFSSQPHEVARCGEAFVRGLRHQKVLACGRHFPGLGSAQFQGHSHPPLIGKTMAELWQEDLIPYRELLPQLPLVLISPGAYKAYDYDLLRPATQSWNIVEGLLRVKLGYRGVAVASELDTEAICPTVDPGEAAVRSVNAGCDLLLVGPREKSLELILAGLTRGLESGKLSRSRLEQAQGRLATVKKGLPSPSGRVAKNALEHLARRFEEFSKECRAPE